MKCSGLGPPLSRPPLVQPSRSSLTSPVSAALSGLMTVALADCRDSPLSTETGPIPSHQGPPFPPRPWFGALVTPRAVQRGEYLAQGGSLPARRRRALAASRSAGRQTC